jgi:hypothetical protein
MDTHHAIDGYYRNELKQQFHRVNFVDLLNKNKLHSLVCSVYFCLLLSDEQTFVDLPK